MIPSPLSYFLSFFFSSRAFPFLHHVIRDDPILLKRKRTRTTNSIPLLTLTHDFISKRCWAILWRRHWAQQKRAVDSHLKTETAFLICLANPTAVHRDTTNLNRGWSMFRECVPTPITHPFLFFSYSPIHPSFSSLYKNPKTPLFFLTLALLISP